MIWGNSQTFASIYVIWCTNHLIFIQISAMNFLLIVNILFFRETFIWNDKVKTQERKFTPPERPIDSLLWDEVCSSNLTEVSNYFLVFSIRSVQLTKQPGRVLCQKLIAAHFDIGESGTYSVQQFIYFPIFPNNYEQNIHYAFWIKKWKGKIFQTWLNRHFILFSLD